MTRGKIYWAQIGALDYFFTATVLQTSPYTILTKRIYITLKIQVQAILRTEKLNIFLTILVESQEENLDRLFRFPPEQSGIRQLDWFVGLV